ncbi:hypothetical protein PsYK624_081830 [Phanerochaete sordida]|uniref:Protein kinase domain-containing protein n=1 Tax=Phanerochaete sordida TaxID=48140 RepID=A0A9P3GC86_9APHY|nr:hypothetical protein PsYK624_081830 [Phanerochaete sordida]
MSSIDKHFVGIISPELFLERFMKPIGGCAAAPSADFSKLEAARTVRQTSETLIRAVEKHKICPGLRLFITKVKKRNIGQASRVDDAHPERTHEQVDSPPVCPPLAARSHARSKRGAKTKRSFIEYHDFATAALAFEVLLSHDEDPFRNPPPTSQDDSSWPSAADYALSVDDAGSPVDHPLPTDDPALGEGCPAVRPTSEAAAVRSRLLSYAEAYFARQHRCFLFQVVVVKDLVRFLRWDRSGVIASSSFSAAQHPYLAQFLWRFDHMNGVQRGWDPTVTLATRHEKKIFEDALREFLRVDTGPSSQSPAARTIPDGEQTLDGTETYPTWRIRVAHEKTGTFTELVTRRPFAGHQTMFGRATRAYLTFDLTTCRLVFLKDAWRANDRRLRPEFRIYQELHAHDVPFIPYPMYGGDVRHPDGQPQETLAHLLIKEPSERHAPGARLEGHIHHRLVQDIAYPLETVRDERELMQAIHDALTALDRAHSELGLLHRDLSSMNVMLSLDGKCLLSDWDHAGMLQQKAQGVGTFQFMSIRLLKSKTVAVNEHVDDLESIFWVFLFVAIIRFAVRLDGINLHIFQNPGPDRWHFTGMSKSSHLCSAMKYRDCFTSEAFTNLLQDLACSWADYQVGLYMDEAKALDPTFPPLSPERAIIMDLAKQPSFWRDKFAAAISKYDAEQAARPQKHPATDTVLAMAELRQNQDGPTFDLPTSAAEPHGRKRKAPAREPSTGEDGPTEPRRSKRLRKVVRNTSCS